MFSELITNVVAPLQRYYLVRLQEISKVKKKSRTSKLTQLITNTVYMVKPMHSHINGNQAYSNYGTCNVQGEIIAM